MSAAGLFGSAAAKAGRTYVELISATHISIAQEKRKEAKCAIPSVVDGLDDEPQRGADGVHILAHDLLDDGGLARIVESSAQLVPPLH